MTSLSEHQRRAAKARWAKMTPEQRKAATEKTRAARSAAAAARRQAKNIEKNTKSGKDGNS